VLRDLLFHVVGDCEQLDDDGDRPASRLLFRHETAHRLEALAEARSRIDGGAFRTPADVVELDTLRERAVDALESAVRETEHPRLLERRVSDLPDRVTEADEQRRSDPSARTIRRSARDYATVTVMAAAVPANEWLVDGLEAAPASRRERF
jgi:hypothetical protein